MSTTSTIKGPPSWGFPNQTSSSRSMCSTNGASHIGNSSAGVFKQHDDKMPDFAADDMTILARLFELESRLTREMEAVHKKIEPLLAARKHEIDGSGGESTAAQEFGLSHAPLESAPVKSVHVTDNDVQKEARWVPLAIRNLPSLTNGVLEQAQTPLDTEVEDLETFALSFLTSVFGGEEWSPGLYYPAIGTMATSKELLPKSKSYYVMDAALEPFLPQQAGEHGAKLSVLFRDCDEENGERRYQRVPLFVCLNHKAPGAKRYTYMGHYSQKRWSDKLDFDRIQEIVPDRVKSFWADLLTRNRPEWLETALMQAFWPRPEYEGVLNGTGVGINGDDTATETEETDTETVTGKSYDCEKHDGMKRKMSEDVKEYIEELREWEKEARLKVQLLKPDHIMEAFKREDAATEPGLRFWWEYLECVGFDRNFYYMLVTEMRKRAGTNDDDQHGLDSTPANGVTAKSNTDVDVSVLSLD